MNVYIISEDDYIIDVYKNKDKAQSVLQKLEMLYGKKYNFTKKELML